MYSLVVQAVHGLSFTFSHLSRWRRRDLAVVLVSEESDGLRLICGFGFRLSLITFAHRPSDGEPKKRQVLAGLKALQASSSDKGSREHEIGEDKQ